MKEYIDKEDAIRAIGQFKKGFRHMKERCAINGCMLEIMALPLAADVVERKRGEWVEVKAKNFYGCIITAYECTNCKKHSVGQIAITMKSDFCPNCGSQNDGR